MRPSTPNLPAAVPRVLSLLPPYPGSALFAAGLNIALRARLPADVKLALAGKGVCITVLDAGLHFRFEWKGEAFRALPGTGVCDLEIAANARDFLLLAQRKVDPDTLFFGRRLAIEGDTELGLLMKNVLDALAGA